MFLMSVRAGVVVGVHCGHSSSQASRHRKVTMEPNDSIPWALRAAGPLNAPRQSPWSVSRECAGRGSSGPALRPQRQVRPAGTRR